MGEPSETIHTMEVYRLSSPPSIPALLRIRAGQSPDRPLLRVGDDRWTVSEVCERTSRVAGMLADRGVTPGDRVAIMAGNRVEILDLILGCAWLGAVAVPINTAVRGRQLHHILTNCAAERIVIENDLLDHLKALPDLASVKQIWTLDGPGSPLSVPVDPLPPPAAGVEPADVGPGDPALILYTSGTTGVSKGVLSPHAQFYWWGVNVGTQLEITEDDVLYTCLPLFHTNALNAFSQALVSGAEYVLGPRFSASRFWTDAGRSGATFTYLIGAMVSILASKEPSELDRAHRIRAALSPATPPGLLEPFLDRFGVVLIDGYGSTETNSVIAANRHERRAGYIGRLQPGFSARIVDENGCEVPAGVSGELLLRNDQPFAFASGYFRMPEATVESWRDLWFHTGDRVCLDDDGWVRFVDRIKDVIRRRGENISSIEVERALAE
ncbi:MAG TPA: AMP-binding protein, partial [Amycolatopsis sp.]|nr:AMP-binding protein [Amycolatopsis sp.]